MTGITNDDDGPPGMTGMMTAMTMDDLKDDKG